MGEIQWMAIICISSDTTEWEDNECILTQQREGKGSSAFGILLDLALRVFPLVLIASFLIKL